jgi:hypothetical protein
MTRGHLGGPGRVATRKLTHSYFLNTFAVLKGSFSLPELYCSYSKFKDGQMKLMQKSSDLVNGARTLTTQVQVPGGSSNMSVVACTTACVGYTYAGAEFAQECFKSPFSPLINVDPNISWQTVVIPSQMAARTPLFRIVIRFAMAILRNFVAVRHAWNFIRLP